jgi:hypothetical protein
MQSAEDNFPPVSFSKAPHRLESSKLYREANNGGHGGNIKYLRFIAERCYARLPPFILNLKLTASEIHTLATLPRELQIMVFRKLDTVSATCLGLTSKGFYAINVDLNGKGAKLYAWCVMPPERRSGHRLYQLLLNWVNRSMTFIFGSFKFIRRETRTWVDGKLEHESYELLEEARQEAERKVGGYWTSATKWVLDLESY